MLSFSYIAISNEFFFLTVPWKVPTSIDVLYFKFSHSVAVSKVVKVLLWVYLKPTEKTQESGTLVHVYRVGRKEHPPNEIVQEHFHTEKVEMKRKTGMWIKVDARKLVNEWFRNPTSNYGIVVQAYDNDGRQLVVTVANAETNSSLVSTSECY